ncbi:MAG: ABC transporter ATP-binding protein [Luteolibacter sp.]
MSDNVIYVENLGKRYLLNHQAQGGRYKTLRDVLSTKAGSLFGARKPEGGHRKSIEEFWALKDVGFEIKQGEAVGIIGRNGAGKSTLLKLLSRITEPTTGRIELEGRVASLLEVGTGFHPELTGRENIYLNGAILGMGRLEIRRKFDEIVEFAEVEKFLDTPVKRYSSGMYMRLAFAVAAHLEPEILVVDEVLAVGDAAFQEKCLGKMGEVSSGGRTILFVSHQMNAVQSLCDRCLLLQQGRLVASGPTAEIIHKYLNKESQELQWRASEADRFGSNHFKPLSFTLVNENLIPFSTDIEARDKIGFLIEGEIDELDPALNVGFAIYTSTNVLLFWSYQSDTVRNQWPDFKKGLNRIVAWLPGHILNEGDYRVELMASLHYRAWICQPGSNSPSINLRITGGLSDSPIWMEARPGILAPVLQYDLVN